MKQDLTNEKRLNLWPLLPFAIIALSLVMAQLVPTAGPEQSSSLPPHGSGQSATR